MTSVFLSVESLDRHKLDGGIEVLSFKTGVNVLVGAPNTGKTKWLQTLDYLFGDPGENPFDGADESGLAEIYDAVGADLLIGDQSVRIERRWREAKAKTKVFVDGESMTPYDFQRWLLEELQIPLLNFPKGNPMSGQTWPELSFRMLLRHIYRQQRFWGDVADAQPESEQHACLLQFLGLAERIFTEDYGTLIELRMNVERLKSRREQYNQTLEEVARDVISEPGLSVAVNPASLTAAQVRLDRHVEDLSKARNAILAGALNSGIPLEQRAHIAELAEKRAGVVVRLEVLRTKAAEAKDRLLELKSYHSELSSQLERMDRAQDAGVVLADLRITHCPACDQTVSDSNANDTQCFLCHQPTGHEPFFEELGAVRLRFERDRLAGELKEADQLLAVLDGESKRLNTELRSSEEDIHKLDDQLAPARQSLGALVRDEISSIDMARGEATERQRQIGRIAGALEVGNELTKRIQMIENEIEPVQQRVNDLIQSTDFQAAASELEDGMNSYLNAINALRPDVWRHSAITIDVSRSGFAIRVGSRRWRSALGGTDTLYFLMAYHYGLLALSGKSGKHYPGLSIIDVPGEFSGEAVEDKENFIIQPFIELLNSSAYVGTQLIVTGASFTGLAGAHRLTLTHVYVV